MNRYRQTAPTGPLRAHRTRAELARLLLASTAGRSTVALPSATETVMAPVLRLYEDTLSNTAEAVGLPPAPRMIAGFACPPIRAGCRIAPF
jgi:hypothetical protein